MTSLLHVARPATPLLAAALALAGCGNGGRRDVAATGPSVSAAVPDTTAAATGSTLGTLAPEDGRPGPDYEADPREYLTPEQLEELKRATVPVLAPTWLPEWTRGITAVAFSEPGRWVISWQAAPDSDNDAVRKLRSSVSLLVSGEALFGEGAEVPTVALNERGRAKAGAVRSYHWEIRNGTCPFLVSEGEELPDDPAAMMRFPRPRGDWLYTVMLAPSPACSRGLFTNADMLKFADSLQPLF